MANSLIIVAVLLGLSGSSVTTGGECYQYCCVSGLVTYQLVSMKCLWEIPVTLIVIAFSLILSHCLFAAAITDRVFRLGTNFTLTCIDNGNDGNNAPSVSFIVNDHILGSNGAIDDQFRSRGINWTIKGSHAPIVGELSIPASVENNATVVRCAAGDVFTPKQRIIVVEGVIITATSTLCMLSLCRFTRPSCSSLSDSDQSDCPHSHLDCSMATPCHQLHCDHAQPHVKPDHSVDCN